MKNYFFLTILFFLFFGTVIIACANSIPRLDEMSVAAQWVNTRFGEPLPIKSNSLIGLYVTANNDSVQKSGRHGKPLSLAGTPKTRGLYVHAFSRIVVYAGEPVEHLTALLAVDSNEQTFGSRGSVVFVVKKIETTNVPNKEMLLGNLKETEVFRSEKLVEGMKPVPLNVSLDGTTAFVLEVEDAGDGIACDQADWADIQITLKNTKKIVSLDELPFRTPEQKTTETIVPFSFKYGDVPSRELLPKWKLEKTRQKIDDHKIQHTLVWTDPETKLVVKCEAVEYLDFPTVEWMLYFKNTGTKNTPILSEIYSVDATMETNKPSEQINHHWQQKNQGAHLETSGRGGNYILHHSTGSPCHADDFKPHETKIVSGDSKIIATNGGRPTNDAMPYFNIQHEHGGGMIVVIGWSGQWSARFTNDPANGMRITGGQELTHFTLYPDEEVRAPRTVLQFWNGSYIRSQNIWRQWMLAYNTPRPNGQLVKPHFAACSSHQYSEMVNATDQTQIEMIDRFFAEGIKLDYWWMDAGWYIMPHSKGWTETGTWIVDPKRFPKGLRAVSDHAHAKKVNIIVWFEPERVHSGTWLAETHPEWILGGKNGGILNLGNPEAWNWLVNHIDNIITKEGIDLYRQDFNIDPLEYWRKNDTEDRQGITEIKHVTGYLAYWDELLRRHPKMLIDTCASGGRRLDIDTLKRAVSLLRSDYIFEPTGNQGHTYGLSLWLPIFGTGTLQSSQSAIYGGKPEIPEPYKTRSLLCPFENSCSDMRIPANLKNKESGSADYPNIRRYFEEWKLIAPYFYGDFYPLTPYNIDNSLWIAWQYDLPKENKGVIQVFRRPESVYDAMRVKLQGLNPQAIYHVNDIDNRINVRKNGQELMEHGLSVSFDNDYGAAIVFYEISGH